MFKRSVFTHITPLPSHVPRDLVVDILHSHSEMIALNPLVTGHRRCDPPASLALPDELEADAAWYEITDRIAYLPGGLLSGSVTYYGCFHDLPRGLQTHVHAPAGLEIRAKWQVGGNMPGEPRAPVELGMEKLRIPREGLYLREDVDLRCSLVLLGMVKKNLKRAHAGLVERLLERTSHLVDAKAQAQALTSTWSLVQQGGSASRPASLYSSHSHCSSNNAGDDRNYSFTRHDSWPGRPASPDTSQYCRYYSQQQHNKAYIKHSLEYQYANQHAHQHAHCYPSLETQLLPSPSPGPAELPSPVSSEQSTPVREQQGERQGQQEEGGYQLRLQSYPYKQQQQQYQSQLRPERKVFRHHPRLQELE